MWGLSKGVAIVVVLAMAVFILINYIAHRSNSD
jgi:hypothetical protein